MDPANRSEISAMTLSRVEQNDPTLKHLVVSSTCHFNPAGRMGEYWPDDSADLARLGDAIGANTNLRKLFIPGSRAFVDMAADNGAFFDGLNINTSICNLDLVGCDLSGGMASEILNRFVANNSNITGIMLGMCTLGNEGAGVLASAVSRCTSMKFIGLFSCNVDDDILVQFVSGIRGLHQFHTLNLSWNNFGRAGCEALATMLQDPSCNLTWLDLSRNNRIDDSCATILAHSLKGNCKLHSLNLSGNGAITENGWDAFSQVLCNTSSVNDTYLSNHTLRDLGVGELDLPANLSSLLELNCGADKKQVAIRHILFHHTHLDMEPFLEWDLKVLPLAVSWFDRARDYVHDESTMELFAIYQFARALPMMFVPPPNKASNKRTIGEVN